MNTIFLMYASTPSLLQPPPSFLPPYLIVLSLVYASLLPWAYLKES